MIIAAKRYDRAKLAPPAHCISAPHSAAPHSAAQHSVAPRYTAPHRAIVPHTPYTKAPHPRITRVRRLNT
ncbi:hypothetical protein DSM100238_1448 [Bifidobacterium apri]|uniref:Uncharacterized protein n=1 Tax=Bifidobacterium apri TaxID=1769423 RepID=A0A6A2V816_9BIFI|nr:hypothetical protein DSM100238_1448 [Bifidobacterium apri]